MLLGQKYGLVVEDKEKVYRPISITSEREIFVTTVEVEAVRETEAWVGALHNRWIE